MVGDDRGIFMTGTQVSVPEYDLLFGIEVGTFLPVENQRSWVRSMVPDEHLTS